MQTIAAAGTPGKGNRIESIDILRGIVMVIMALDHVRDYFHVNANIDDPLNLATTTPILFFTRYITHFCAPTFVFLSGVSAYLQSLRKTKKELSIFLIKRGLWLVFVELFIIALAWTFDPMYHVFPVGVIWAIGISMTILGFVIWLPYRLILIAGLVIVFGHNLLDIPEAAKDFKPGFWWDLIHHGFFAAYTIVPNHFLLIVYPFLAWTGLMMLGYCAGIFFTDKYTSAQRSKITARIGIGLILFFIVVRFINVYGDPVPWTTQNTTLLTILSFLKVNKYPPSLMYMSITVGVAFLMLSLLENLRNKFTSIMLVYGRTAFFYYVVHIYLIHILATIIFFAKGQHTVQDAVDSMPKLPFLFVIPGEGVGLITVYIIWASLVIALYPLCKWYDKYKPITKKNGG